jgi:hypothetical protein
MMMHGLVNIKDATIYVNLFSLSALHVSGDVSAHRQQFQFTQDTSWQQPV